MSTNDSPSQDRPISLIDTTVPQTEAGEQSREPSPDTGWRGLVKKPTHSSVREHLAQRKYAKWQHERFLSESGDVEGGEADRSKSTVIFRTDSSQRPSGSDVHGPDNVQAVAFAPIPDSPGSGRGRSTSRDGKRDHKPRHKHKEPPSEVDILYENQRGLFLCGIPLYSHSSLLNFDPAPWVTKDLKDSPVNIANAQVPDPSWIWAWKSWYVDMSYDVDEEGWQYSFSFGRRWSWHGSHPWFHSYVRRRRWLRKRVKKRIYITNAADGSMNAAHLLTADYFTIHPTRERSPGSTIKGTARSSFIGRQSATGVDDTPEDIKSIPSLIKALRLAAIDREKIDAVKRFVEQGGEELVYLEQEIPEITSFLVFQTSRRQLLEFLQEAADEARGHREQHQADKMPEDEAEKRRIGNLLNAARALNEQIGELEYWSDRQPAHDIPDPEKRSPGPNTHGNARTKLTEDDPVQEIKGISEKAEIADDSAHGFVETRQGIGGGSVKRKETAQEIQGSRGEEGQISGLLERLPLDSTLVTASDGVD